MNKNFDDFEMKISEDKIVRLTGENVHTFKLIKNNGEPAIDVSELAAHIVTISLNFTKEILRQYHEWLHSE